jgi:hypothetical protein
MFPELGRQVYGLYLFMTTLMTGTEIGSVFHQLTSF